MLKLLFFLSIFFSSYSDLVGSSVNIDRYIDYLSERGVVDRVHASFVKNNTINKEDIMYYLYKIFKVLDMTKANSDDILVLESMVSEIVDYINELKLKNKNDQEIVKDILDRISYVRDEIKRLNLDVKVSRDRLKQLEERVIRNLDYEENHMRDFIKSTDLYAKLHFLSKFEEKEISFPIELDLTLKRDDLTFQLYRSNFFRDNLMFNFNLRGYLVNFIFHSSNFKRVMLSPRRSMLFDTYSPSRGMHSKVGGGISNDYLDLFIFKDEDEANLVLRVNYDYFDFAFNGNFTTEKVEFLELTGKIPISNRVSFGIGIESKGRLLFDRVHALVKYSLESFESSLTFFADDKFEKKTLTPMIIYKFNEKGLIASVFDIDFTSASYFSKWELYFEYISDMLSFQLKSGSDAENLDEYFIGTKLKVYNLVDIGFFIKGSSELDYAYILKFNLPTVMGSFNLRYIKSNFDFADNLYDIYGKNISYMMENDSFKKSTPWGAISFGLTVEI